MARPAHFNLVSSNLRRKTPLLVFFVVVIPFSVQPGAVLLPLLGSKLPLRGAMAVPVSAVAVAVIVTAMTVAVSSTTVVVAVLFGRLTGVLGGQVDDVLVENLVLVLVHFVGLSRPLERCGLIMRVAVTMVVAVTMGQGEADQARDHRHSRQPREKEPLENGGYIFLTFETHLRMAESWLTRIHG